MLGHLSPPQSGMQETSRWITHSPVECVSPDVLGSWGTTQGCSQLRGPPCLFLSSLSLHTSSQHIRPHAEAAARLTKGYRANQLVQASQGNAHHQSQALGMAEMDETQLRLSHSSFASLGGGPCPGANFPKGNAPGCTEMHGMGL